MVVDRPAPAEGLDRRCSGAPRRSVRAGRSDRAQLGLQVARPGDLRRSPEAFAGGAPRRDDGNLHTAGRRGVRRGRRPGAEHHEPAAGVASPVAGGPPRRHRATRRRPARRRAAQPRRRGRSRRSAEETLRSAPASQIASSASRAAAPLCDEDDLSPGKTVPLRRPLLLRSGPAPGRGSGANASEVGCEDRSGEEPALECGSRGEQDGSSAGAQGGLDDRRELPRAHTVRLGHHDEAGGVGARRRTPAGERGGLDAGDRLEGSGGRAARERPPPQARPDDPQARRASRVPPAVRREDRRAP